MEFNLEKSKILVTGATGLVGGHLAEILAKHPKNVFVLSRSLNKDSYFVKQGLHKKVKTIKADILEYKKLLNILKQNKIEYIFHLAAQLKVVTVYETFAFNIMGVNNILEAARNSGTVKGVILASSNRAYVEGGLTAKEMKQLSQSPYDISKTAADLVAQSFQKTYNLPLVIARFGNVYGPGDLYNRVVSLIVKNIIAGKTLKLKVSKSKRSYIYASDVASGLVEVAKNIESLKGEAVTFESRESFSVLELINKVTKIVGKECKYEIVGSMPEDILMKKLKVNPKQKVLNWKVRTSFEEGILKTYQSYENDL